MPLVKPFAAWITACLMAGTATGYAQELALPPGPESPLMPSAQGPSQYDKNQAHFFGQNAPLEATPFIWGPLSLYPSLSYNYSASDGIESEPGHPSTTVVQTVSPGFMLSAGNHWSIDYAPSWTFYSSPLFHDTVDQQLQLACSNSIDDWGLQFSQGYARTSDPLVETGAQTLVNDYSTQLNASYGMNADTRVEFDLSQSVRVSPAVPTTYDWTSVNWFHYLVFPQMDAALGPQLGYTEEPGGINMAYLKSEAQLNWIANDELSINLQGGLEDRKFIASGAKVLNSSTFSAAVDYKPWDTTTLTVGASRGVSPSLTADEITESTGLNLSVQQRLFRHFSLGVAVGQERNVYFSTSGQLANVRADQLETLHLSLSTKMFRRCTIALQYGTSHNDSNSTGFGFSSHQYGFSVGYRY
jgi:hypothetical protein